MDWINEAKRERTALEQQAKTNPKLFYHKDGVVRAVGRIGKPDGDGARRAELLTAECELLAQGFRGLVRA
jgi:hypothetical protein